MKNITKNITIQYSNSKRLRRRIQLAKPNGLIRFGLCFLGVIVYWYRL